MMKTKQNKTKSENKKPDGHPTMTACKANDDKGIVDVVIELFCAHTQRQTNDAEYACVPTCGGRQHVNTERIANVKESNTWHRNCVWATRLTSVHVFAFICKLERWIQWCSVHCTMYIRRVLFDLWYLRYNDFVYTIRTTWFVYISYRNAEIVSTPTSYNIQINHTNSTITNDHVIKSHVFCLIFIVVHV